MLLTSRIPNTLKIFETDWDEIQTVYELYVIYLHFIRYSFTCHAESSSVVLLRSVCSIVVLYIYLDNFRTCGTSPVGIISAQSSSYLPCTITANWRCQRIYRIQGFFYHLLAEFKGDKYIMYITDIVWSRLDEFYLFVLI